MKKLIPALILMASTHAYSQTDTLIGKNIPVSKDYKKLTSQVCANAQTEQLKANAIFNWIATHISFDIALAKNPDRKEETAKSVLEKGSATNNGYVTLFVEMCKEAGLNAIGIDGYSKAYYTDNGDPYYNTSSSWCAVQIDGLWHIVDPASGAGKIVSYTPWFASQVQKLSKSELRYDTKERFEFKYAPAYFMPNPLWYRTMKVPEHPLWQLTKVYMPLHVFEQSDSAINEFNRVNTQLEQRDTRMLKMANQQSEERMLETADGIYAYNKRFVAIKGAKMVASANIRLARVSDVKSVKEVKATLKEALGYYKEQKQAYPEYFSMLLRKNDSKNREALEYIRQIETSGRLYISKCERYIESCNAKKITLKERNERLMKPIKVLKSSEKVSLVKDPYSPEMEKLVDSIGQRGERLLKMHKISLSMADSLSIVRQRHQYTYDNTIQTINQSLELLSSETESRIIFKDQYDDDVRKQIPVYKELRFTTVDTLMRIYFNEHDELNRRYDELEKELIAAKELSGLMLKDVAAFMAWTRNSNSLGMTYDGTLKIFNEHAQTCAVVMAQHSEVNDIIQKQINKIKEMYENEHELIKNMKIAEAARHEKENKDLKEKREFDEGINKRQQQNINVSIEKLDTFLKNNK